MIFVLGVFWWPLSAVPKCRSGGLAQVSGSKHFGQGEVSEEDIGVVMGMSCKLDDGHRMRGEEC